MGRPKRSTDTCRRIAHREELTRAGRRFFAAEMLRASAGRCLLEDPRDEPGAERRLEAIRAACRQEAKWLELRAARDLALAAPGKTR